MNSEEYWLKIEKVGHRSTRLYIYLFIYLFLFYFEKNSDRNIQRAYGKVQNKETLRIKTHIKGQQQINDTWYKKIQSNIH